MSTIETNLEGEHIALGDFNLHHPSWGGEGVRLEEEAEDLLTRMSGIGMEQLVEPGTVTWREGERKSTIDLIFIIPLLNNTVIRCGIPLDFNVHSNYYPIATVFEIQAIGEPAVSK